MFEHVDDFLLVGMAGDRAFYKISGDDGVVLAALTELLRESPELNRLIVAASCEACEGLYGSGVVAGLIDEARLIFDFNSLRKAEFF
jgi:hypothetical protein